MTDTKSTTSRTVHELTRCSPAAAQYVELVVWTQLTDERSSTDAASALRVHHTRSYTVTHVRSLFKLKVEKGFHNDGHNNSQKFNFTGPNLGHAKVTLDK